MYNSIHAGGHSPICVSGEPQAAKALLQRIPASFSSMYVLPWLLLIELRCRYLNSEAVWCSRTGHLRISVHIYRIHFLSRYMHTSRSCWIIRLTPIWIASDNFITRNNVSQSMRAMMAALIRRSASRLNCCSCVVPKPIVIIVRIKCNKWQPFVQILIISFYHLPFFVFVLVAYVERERIRSKKSRLKDRQLCIVSTFVSFLHPSSYDRRSAFAGPSTTHRASTSELHKYSLHVYRTRAPTKICGRARAG